MSDAEREHVGILLQRAVGQGMLSLGEFTERLDTALAARTRSELNAVLADLPGIRIVAPVAAPQPPPGYRPPPHYRPITYRPPPPGYRPPPPGYRPPLPGPNHDVVRGWFSNISRKGAWRVPPHLQVHARMSAVTLDFSQATLSSPVVELAVDSAFSSITLVLPEQATVDVNAIQLLASDITSKVRTGPPAGGLHLVVRGRISFGSATARHPFGTGIRRMMGQGGSQP